MSEHLVPYDLSVQFPPGYEPLNLFAPRHNPWECSLHGVVDGPRCEDCWAEFYRRRSLAAGGE